MVGIPATFYNMIRPTLTVDGFPIHLVESFGQKRVGDRGNHVHGHQKRVGDELTTPTFTPKRVSE